MLYYCYWSLTFFCPYFSPSLVLIRLYVHEDKLGERFATVRCPSKNHISTFAFGFSCFSFSTFKGNSSLNSFCSFISLFYVVVWVFDNCILACLSIPILFDSRLFLCLFLFPSKEQLLVQFIFPHLMVCPQELGLIFPFVAH